MEEFLQHFADYDVFNWLFSIVSFLAGAYVGHRFNIWQDKRREFNEKWDRIYPLIKGEVEDPDTMVDPVDDTDFEILWWLMYPWQRKGFSASFKAYKAAKAGKEKRGNYPRLTEYCEPEKVSAAAANLLPYLKRR